MSAWPRETPPTVVSRSRKVWGIVAASLGPFVGLHGLSNVVRREWLRAGGRFMVGALAASILALALVQDALSFMGPHRETRPMLVVGWALYLYLWVAGIVWAFRVRMEP